MDLKSQLGTVTDRAAWAGRRASFMAKVKATKAVWFPPQAAELGGKASSTGKKATKKATGSAKKTTRTAKKATKGV